MSRGLYIQLFSIHGLVRSENMEMGRDADTGGQIKYVVELGKSLGRHPAVRQVDLFTRLIADKGISVDYSNPIEQVDEKFRIVRIQCGGRKYMRKELLWPHLDEFVDKTLIFIKREGSIPDVFHGHYADAGYVAMQLSEFFGTPFVFTGHSLGRSKRQKLINEGMSEDDVVKKYRIDRRIDTEEKIMEMADLVITSTSQEVEKQYGMYHNRTIPDYSIIPPGLDLEKFSPFYHGMLPENRKDEMEKHAYVSVLNELNRFFIFPEKPLILALCRPDKRKNIAGLIRAYGESLELQAMANLAIFAGIRKWISDMEENEKDVLTEMLLLMDAYDLYGKMAIPKKHDFEYEVPELYHITGERRGVFVNVALTEPFGLTLLEASACGIPMVATNDGGPRDIVENCKNGVLVDPSDTAAIAVEIKKIITEPERWDKYSRNGAVNVRKHYTWEAHVEKYTSALKKLLKGTTREEFSPLSANPVGKRITGLNYFLVTDIDNTLIGDDNSGLPGLIEILKEHRDSMGFALATGRTVDSALKYIKKYDIPAPDIVISSVGSEIYYGDAKFYDKGWDTHISHRWERDRIREILDRADFLEIQEEETQRKYKISYFMEPGRDRQTRAHELLLAAKLKYNLIYSHNQFLDILPYRASKGKAIRYISYKWDIPMDNILVCGDSGNDEEMLRGDMPAVVVGNYSEELEKLRGLRKIYFAERAGAGGITEGINYYDFLNRKN
ncbi:MAG: glycosyl transferase family 1 [Spirochaetae bacterium HGW-Spirochaetae-1]|nr:MAG: glycosyl transferase family 1 [Spirochaetae bacterium HGW-Spirochaetae-1]